MTILEKKDQAQLSQLLLDWENETVEFKNPPDTYSIAAIGKYFSALANEANLTPVMVNSCLGGLF